MCKSPPDVDADAFRRRDGKPIDGHSSWWKIYDLSNAEVYEDRMDELKISAIARTRVTDKDFEGSAPRSIIYEESEWGVPIRLITGIRRDKKKRIVAYCVSDQGWLGFHETLAMTCSHQIDNARPVFPKRGRPYIRTRKDQEWINNIEVMGLS